MCNFLSFTGDGYGNFQYINWEIRKDWLSGKVKLPGDGPDSHTTILESLKIPAGKQERYSKYEYNPLTKIFKVDELAPGHDEEEALNWVQAQDMRRIVGPLFIKPIVNPFGRTPPKKITKAHLTLLKNWASVRTSVGTSVRASVEASVRASVGDSVWASVEASVWASVGASVWDSVRDSVWAYTSSFFYIKYKHDFSSLNKLWAMGLVPSFDGKKWRLHGGPHAKILWNGKI